ncbi:MAG: AAA domain-containing protein [Burkholderiales bacterium]
MNGPSPVHHRTQISARTEQAFKGVLTALSSERAVVVVKAPPGSGKTYLLSRVVQALAKREQRIAIAAQTNAQADDLCRRLADAPWKVRSYRFVGSGGGMDEPAEGVTEVSSFDDLPIGPCVVVGTSAKWGLAQIKQWFDVLLVDEAWQMQWLQFIPLGRVASRFVLIGDPGQIPPVVAIDASRWETAEIPPHLAAPEVICSGVGRRAGVVPVELQLPASRRLPYDAVELLQPFYDFPFASWALPGERAVVATGRIVEPIDRGIDLLAEGSVVGVTIPTVDDLPASDMDEDVAELVVRIATRILERKAKVRMLDIDDGHGERPVTAQDIGISATHRMMNELIARRVARSSVLEGVRVDTPERWQGLQRLITIAVHPLSGVLRPSSFDLETGRLCVMASRHQGGLIVAGRDHIADTLDGLIVAADQPIGRPDIAGRGHQQHLKFWRSLEAAKRVVSL